MHSFDLRYNMKMNFLINKTEKLKRHKKIICVVLIFFAFLLWGIWGNITLKVSKYTVESDNLPKSFVGFKIAHVSDFHDAEIGKNNKKIISALKKASPDIIAITGDLVDCNRPDVELSLEFVKEAVKIAPCYYVTGNHEAWLTDENFSKLENGLLEYGVNVLRGKSAFFEKDGEKILISGIEDSDFALKNHEAPSSHMSVENIKALSDFEGYKILLSHKPEYFDNYVEAEVDLVLSGHVHGGQFRIPFIGGVYSPDQGFFPEYDSGIYEKNETKMCVSRGIGNSVFPFRLNNRPELIIIELK